MFHKHASIFEKANVHICVHRKERTQDRRGPVYEYYSSLVGASTPKAFIPIEDVPTDNSGSVHHVTEGLLMFWVCSNN